MTETHICLVYYNLLLLNALLYGHVQGVHEVLLAWR